MIRIFIVDDHPIVRSGLTAALEDQPDFSVVGATESAEEALETLESAQPDVILLDLELGGMDGVTAISRFLEKRPGSRILVFTAYDADERVLGSIEAGAKGYLLKGASSEEIARAIRDIHKGGSYLESRVAAKILSEIPRRSNTRLSRREREALRLVAEGAPDKRIAQELGITERTVRFHLTSAFEKLGAENRTQAVTLAIQRGFLDLSDKEANPNR